MTRKNGRERRARGKEDMWVEHQHARRSPLQICSQWQEAVEVDPRLLQFRASGDFWDILEDLDITLLVSREYEHLLMSFSRAAGHSVAAYFPLPHPSGIAIHRERGEVAVASTRNPNQVFTFRPVPESLPREGQPRQKVPARPLVPVASSMFPGCLYLHDLAFVGKELYGNAVGMNAVARLHPDATYETHWWPRCVEGRRGPELSRNLLQLNSIGAGKTITSSYFSASTDQPSVSRRPGHLNFKVDGTGVIFSGKTREAIVRGLTRPHSVRLYGGEIWVNNSGYGELGSVSGQIFEPQFRLPGWTRGLCFCGSIAFVGISRVIPRWKVYAPGLEVETCRCSVYALDVKAGKILGALDFPNGNQIFAIDWLSRRLSQGFPFRSGRAMNAAKMTQLFSTFSLGN